MSFQPIFYFPVLAIPVMLLLYFSGPLSAAGLTLLVTLIGLIGVIFSAEGLFSGTSIGEQAAPVIFSLQMVWLWALFWISEKLIELRDLEKHQLQEDGEKLELAILDYQKEQKEIEKFATGLEERIARYSQLREFTDQLAGIVKLKEIQLKTEDSVRKIFSGDYELKISLEFLSFPNVPNKDDALSEWVVRHKAPLLVSDSSQDLRFPSKKLPLESSLMSCPIEREDFIVGHLTVLSELPKKWKEEDLRFLSDISNIVSIAVANAVYYEKVESLAVHDSLTGLYVRYRFDERVEEEFARAKAAESPLSLILFDLDHFKHINDKWGHLEGDLVLKTVADIVLKQTRETDFCARFGGEEIAVLMPHTHLKNSYSIAERIRKTVEAAVIGTEKIRVTMSGGVAVLKPSMKTPQNFIEAADRALYEAKDSGRNRLVKVDG